MPKKIFVTGGAGYIGAHICIELLSQNNKVLVFDNLSNSSERTLKKIELLTGKKLEFFLGDIRDSDALSKAMGKFKPNIILHLAGLKSIEESISKPLSYYNVNVNGSLNILDSMASVGCNEIVFSSSATVYCHKEAPPYLENSKTDPSSPYGRTKLTVETILKDWVRSDNKNRAVVLRYFNPVGAHESGVIGESLSQFSNNLMPLITQVAIRKRDYLSVYGSDYATKDGSGERDFIHVQDLSLGHIKAIEAIYDLEQFQIFNLGTGKGTTVFELIRAFEKSNGVSVPFKIMGRRSGDVERSLADTRLATNLLNFKCEKTLEEMCFDSWQWRKKNI